VNWYQKQYRILPNYSHIIEQITSTQEERVNLLKPFFEATEEEIGDGIKKPTIAHRAIAQLVQKGYIRVIITTNFDRLMENALRDIGVEATVISSPNHIDNVMPLIHSPITIIKVNGDYLDTKFLNIETELSSYDTALVDLLKYVFENFGLITVGWSAKWDIALREILENSNKFRFSNYFTYMHKSEQELENIASLRRGKLVLIKDANSFFKELFENVEALENGEKKSPLSKSIAISRLKKYIEREDQTIPLFELVNEELQSTFAAINGQSFPYPDNTAIKNILELEIKRMDVICSLIIEGVYWGKVHHHSIWTRAISKFAHPTAERSGYVIWGNLLYFPALLLFYSSGLAALYKEDFLFLRKLFAIQILNPDYKTEKVNILENLNTEFVIAKDDLKQVYNTTQHVPMSELLYKNLKPYFGAWLINDKEFDELFDLFELLNSLKFLEIGKTWFPYGRFIYRRRPKNIIETKFKDLNTLKENFDWIKGGLFPDFNQLLEDYRLFNEQIKKIPWVIISLTA
jgi:hypothetical protein